MRYRSALWARGPLSQARLGEAAEAFVRRFGVWTVFVTVTFKVDEVSERRAFGMSRTYLRRVAQAAKEHIPYVLAMEPQWRGVPHTHFLLQASDNATRLILRSSRKLWRETGYIAGRIDCQRYDALKFGTRYLVNHDYWDVNVACPRFAACRRLKGDRVCKEAPGPWT